MALEFKREVVSLKGNADNFVTQVVVRLWAVDGEYTTIKQFVTEFDLAQHQGPVVPLADLNESIVLGWVEAVVGDFNAFEAQLEEEIELKKTLVVDLELPKPW
jgi:hypothetical protein